MPCRSARGDGSNGRSGHPDSDAASSSCIPAAIGAACSARAARAFGVPDVPPLAVADHVHAAGRGDEDALGVPCAEAEVGGLLTRGVAELAADGLRDLCSRGVLSRGVLDAAVEGVGDGLLAARSVPRSAPRCSSEAVTRRAGCRAAAGIGSTAGTTAGCSDGERPRPRPTLHPQVLPDWPSRDHVVYDYQLGNTHEARRSGGVYGRVGVAR